MNNEGEKSVSRRGFLKGGASGSIAALAGCNGLGGKPNREKNPYNQNKTEEADFLDEDFQYHFTDAEGFNQVGGQIPEDVESHQVVDSFLNQEGTEVQTWDEMLENDYNKARLALDGSTEPLANQDLDGSVEEIVDKTEQYFNNFPDSAEEYNGGIPDLSQAMVEAADDKAEKFSHAVRSAVKDVTGQSNSAAADVLNTNLAEYILSELDVDIPGYKLSTLYTGVRTVTDDEDEKTNFSHPIGFLQYEDDGEAKTKHFELESLFSGAQSKEPENTIYRTPADGTSTLPNGARVEDNIRFIETFDYEKAREIEERDEWKEGGGGPNYDFYPYDVYMIGGLIELVDDAGTAYDFPEDVETGADWNSPERGLHGVVSDSFGKSVSDYVVNPTTEKREYLKGTSRALFSAMSKHGWGEAVAVDGTIENPEIYHTTKQKVRQIKSEGNYADIGQQVMTD